MFLLHVVFLMTSLVLMVTGIRTCCPPAQWEADVSMIMMTVVSGRTINSHGTMKLSVDELNKMTVTDQKLSVVGNPDKILQTIVSDYNTNVSYAFHGDQCTTMPLTFNNYGCISDNATSESYSIGLGNAALNVTTYHVDYVDLHLHTTVTEDTCIPISQTIVNSRDDGSYTLTMVFSNITPGLKSRSVFDVPSQCSHSKIPPVGRRR